MLLSAKYLHPRQALVPAFSSRSGQLYKGPVSGKRTDRLPYLSSNRGTVCSTSAEDDKQEDPGWKPTFLSEDSTARKEADVQKAREKFWGRIAVLGFGAVLLSERISGRGIVTALNMATGVPVWEIEPFLGLVVGGLVATALYVPLRRVAKRIEIARMGPEEAAKRFTKEPERTVGDSFQIATGRVATLALAGTILAEATTGKGILALLNVETGVETISEIEWGITFLLLLLLTEDVVKRPQ